MLKRKCYLLKLKFLEVGQNNPVLSMGTLEGDVPLRLHSVAALHLREPFQQFQRPLLAGIGPGRHLDRGLPLPAARAWNRVGGSDNG